MNINWKTAGRPRFYSSRGSRKRPGLRFFSASKAIKSDFYLSGQFGGYFCVRFISTCGRVFYQLFFVPDETRRTCTASIDYSINSIWLRSRIRAYYFFRIHHAQKLSVRYIWKFWRVFGPSSNFFKMFTCYRCEYTRQTFKNVAI